MALPLETYEIIIKEEPDSEIHDTSLSEEIIVKVEFNSELTQNNESIKAEHEKNIPVTTTSLQIPIPEQPSSYDLLLQDLPREIVNDEFVTEPPSEDLYRHKEDTRKRTRRCYCSVYGCLISSATRPELTFFSLPAEKDRRERWLKLMNREDLLEKGNHHYICQLHFQKQDIGVNATRKILKKTAVPCLLLPRMKFADAAVQVNDIVTHNVYVQTQRPIVSDMIVQTAKSLYNDTVRITKLQTQLAECRKQLRENQKNSKKAQIEKFHKLCDQFLSKQLADLIKAQTKLKCHNPGNRYTLPYKIFCLNLYQVSPQAYRLLEKAFFLPCRNTLNRLYVPVSSEVNDDLMETLRVKVNSMSDLEKNCTVVVNTMWLTSSLFYNVSDDKIIGFREVDGVQSPVPVSNALVLIVQGLFVQWIQPIGYALLSDNKDYKNDISQWVDKILTKLFGIGLRVRAFTSDVESGLSEMAEKKCVSIDRPFFIVNNIKVYYIYDSRQLLMHLRDNFLKYNFYYKGNCVAKFEHVKQFYDYDSTKNIKLAEKLTKSHIKPTIGEKSKVCYATELFSKPVAAGLSTYVNFNLIEMTAIDTVNFLLMIDNLFNTLNSVISCENDPQVVFLYEMLNFFQSLKIINSKSGDDVTESCNFIKGFQITIMSILYLIEDLKQEGHKRLLTSNLNLDQIKKFIDKVRAKDNCGEKPTSRQFVPAFRRLYFSNMFKGSKSGRADDVSTFLVKLSEFNHSTASDIDNTQIDGYQFVSDKQHVNKLNEVTPATYSQLEVPEDNSLQYVTEFLYNKIVDKHKDCEVFKFNIDSQQPFHDYHGFIHYVQSMDSKFCEAFNAPYINTRIGMFIYEQIKTIPFMPPCPCFPTDYLQKLFVRIKIYLLIKSNNKGFRTQRNKKEKSFFVKNL